MKKVELTHYYDIDNIPDYTRALIFNEFAENGAKNIVLADALYQNLLTKKFADRLKADAAAAGVRFVDAHAPFGDGVDITTYDPGRRRMIVEWSKVVLELTAEFGVDSITFHLSSPPVDECPVEVRRDIAVSVLEKILPVAESHGITICLENVWSPINSVPVLVAIMEHFNSPYLGVCYDAGHANIMSEKNGKAVSAANPLLHWGICGREPEWDDHILEKLLPYVVNCHLHDNDGSRDMHVLPGQGNIDWPHIMKLLGQAPRLRYVQNETVPKRFEPACSIGHICRTFDSLMTMMK